MTPWPVFSDDSLKCKKVGKVATHKGWGPEDYGAVWSVECFYPEKSAESYALWFNGGSESAKPPLIIT